MGTAAAAELADELRPGRAGAGRWRPLVVLVVGTVMATAVQMRFPYLNGPTYFTWIWQLIPPRTFVPGMVAAAAPVFAGVVVYDRTRRRDWGMFLIVLGFMAVTLTLSVMQPRMGGFERTNRIVRSPGATSYFTAAKKYFGGDHPMTVREFLGRYPELQPEFFLHAQTKPPGPILYYAMWVKAFGAGNGTSLAAGLFLLVLAGGSLVAVEWLVRLVTGEQDAGVYAAACLALCPSTVVFYPGFDNVYPALGCAMIGTWVLAVRTGRVRYAVLFGISLAVAVFFSYVLLILGTFLAGYSVVALWFVGGWNVRRLVIQSGAAIFTLVCVYAVLRLVTGYDAVAAYREATVLQAAALSWLKRPYPRTIGWDLYDFTLGAGWVTIVLAVLFLMKGRRRVTPELMAVAWLALLQPVVIAVTGLVSVETSRVWQVLMAVVMVPVGAELARWDRAGRLTAMVALFAVLVAVAGRLVFIMTEPLAKLQEVGLL